MFNLQLSRISILQGQELSLLLFQKKLILTENHQPNSNSDNSDVMPTISIAYYIKKNE